MDGGNFGDGGALSLGGGSSSNGPQRSAADILSQFNQPAQPSPQPPANSIFSQAAMQQPQPQTAARPSNDLLSSTMSPPLTASQPGSKPATPIPPSLQQQHQLKKSDPFASLATPPRQNSPFQFQQAPSRSPAPPSQPPAQAQQSSGMDLLGMGMGNGNPAAAPQAQPRVSTSNDDEWTFSSALPDQPTGLTVTNSAIKTVFSVSRASESEMVIQSRISNNTANPIGDLTFQLAVTKVSLSLHPSPSPPHPLQTCVLTICRATHSPYNPNQAAPSNHTNKTASRRRFGSKASKEGRARR